MLEEVAWEHHGDRDSDVACVLVYSVRVYCKLSAASSRLGTSKRAAEHKASKEGNILGDISKEELWDSLVRKSLHRTRLVSLYPCIERERFGKQSPQLAFVARTFHLQLYRFRFRTLNFGKRYPKNLSSATDLHFFIIEICFDYSSLKKIFLLINAGLLSASAMGLWHGVEYYEKEKIVGEEYYQQWTNVSDIPFVRHYSYANIRLPTVRQPLAKLVHDTEESLTFTDIFTRRWLRVSQAIAYENSLRDCSSVSGVDAVSINVFIKTR